MLLHRLPNGVKVWIRPISPDDKAELSAGLKRLSLETVHRRFLAAKPRLSSTELRYLTEVDGVDHIAIVATSVRTGHIVGVARAVRLADQPDTAEWAVVVADPLQGQGLGTRLVQEVADRAGAVGIRRFTASMLGDNEAARRLLHRIQGVLERDEMHAGVREVTYQLAA